MNSSAQLVVDNDTFRAILDELKDEPIYALDTEFHRERTYYPRLALMQLAWRDRVAVVDPLAADVAPMREILEGPGVSVIHAARQDLEVLLVACGAVPGTVFDTQVAAGFLGMVSPALVTLLEKEFRVRLPKSDRLTDWLARPLSSDQLDYAAADVSHLLELGEKLRARLEKRGRLAWVEDECASQREQAIGSRDPVDAWRRIKEVRQLRGRSAAVAQAVAAWREERAASIDQPVRFVLPDLAVVAIAQRPPKNVKDLARVRGVDGRHLKGPLAEPLLEAVERGIAAEPPTVESSLPPLSPGMRAAIPLLAAWVGQVARDEDLDAALLATRNDLEAFLRSADGSRLASGWRADLLGRPLRDLLEGRAAISFHRGSLVLERRPE